MPVVPWTGPLLAKVIAAAIEELHRLRRHATKGLVQREDHFVSVPSVLSVPLGHFFTGSWRCSGKGGVLGKLGDVRAAIPSEQRRPDFDLKHSVSRALTVIAGEPHVRQLGAVLGAHVTQCAQVALRLHTQAATREPGILKPYLIVPPGMLSETVDSHITERVYVLEKLSRANVSEAGEGEAKAALGENSMALLLTE